MPGLISSSSTPISSPTSFGAGFSEVGGTVQPINVNISGKVKSKAGVSPVINLTDHGAVAAAAKVSSESLKQVELIGTRLSATVDKVLQAITASTKVSTEAVSSANRTETENLGLAAIKWGALVAGAFVLARSFGVLK